MRLFCCWRYFEGFIAFCRTKWFDPTLFDLKVYFHFQFSFNEELKFRRSSWTTAQLLLAKCVAHIFQFGHWHMTANFFFWFWWSILLFWGLCWWSVCPSPGNGFLMYCQGCLWYLDFQPCHPLMVKAYLPTRGNVGVLFLFFSESLLEMVSMSSSDRHHTLVAAL